MSIGIESYWRDEKMSEMVTLRHYDCEVDAVWTIDQEADDSLQIVYERDGLPNGEKENFWLYLCTTFERPTGSTWSGALPGGQHRSFSW
jgi:hypothetical protein